MATNPKSGRDILAEFFASIESLDGVDRQVAQILKQLHDDGKLTNVNIANELQRIREETASGQRQAD